MVGHRYTVYAGSKCELLICSVAVGCCHTDALQLYMEALKHAAPPIPTHQGEQSASPGECAVLASNIAAVLLKLGREEEALEYADRAAQVQQPTRPGLWQTF